MTARAKFTFIWFIVAYLFVGGATAGCTTRVEWRSDKVTLVENWIRDIFGNTPDVAELPFPIPPSGDREWFTLDEVRKYTNQNPELRSIVDKKVAEVAAFKEGFIKLHQVFPPHITSSDVIRIRARSLIFINPVKPKHPFDLEERIVAGEGPLHLEGLRNINSLVLNQLFRLDPRNTNATKLPKLLPELIQEDFDQLLAGMPMSNQSKLKGCKLEFGIPKEHELLWMQTKHNRGVKPGKCAYQISISPVMVRAVIVSNVAEVRRWEYLYLDSEKDHLADFFIKSIKDDFYFVIAHEMGHVFYDSEAGLGVEDEECIDWGARQLESRARVKTGVEGGAFFKLLVMAVNQGEGRLWNLETNSSKNDIMSRFKALDQDKIPDQCSEHLSLEASESN